MAESFKAVRPGRTLADLNRDAAAAHDYSGDSPEFEVEYTHPGADPTRGTSKRTITARDPEHAKKVAEAGKFANERNVSIKPKKGKDEKDVRHPSSGGQQVTRGGEVVAEHDEKTKPNTLGKSMKITRKATKNMPRNPLETEAGKNKRLQLQNINLRHPS